MTSEDTRWKLRFWNGEVAYDKTRQTSTSSELNWLDDESYW